MRSWSVLLVGLMLAASVVSGSLLAPRAEGATAVKVCGSGYGHGVGLSQWGAYGRAKAGQGYARIVKAYYRGVSLQKFSTNPTVRVLLGSKSLGGSHDVAVHSGSKARLRNLATGGTVALGSGVYRVEYLSDKKLYRVTNISTGKSVGSFTGPVAFEPVSGGPLGYGGKNYRGTFKAQVSGSSFLMVNGLRLENYIRGVVPNEMYTSWPQAALRSQAIASRSYARSARRSGPYDLTLGDEAYGGASSETAATNNAVAATARVAAVYDGKAITAFYSASAGGYTEDSAYVFSASPYLKAVKDVDGSGHTFESRVNSPWTHWSGALDSNGSSELGIGSITGASVLDRSPSGRATKVAVTGTNGKTTISGEYNVRSHLESTGLRRADGSSFSAGDLPSARVSFGAACG